MSGRPPAAARELTVPLRARWCPITVPSPTAFPKPAGSARSTNRTENRARSRASYVLERTLTRSMVSKGARRAWKEGRPERARIGSRSGVEKVWIMAALEGRTWGAGEEDAEVEAMAALGRRVLSYD